MPPLEPRTLPAEPATPAPTVAVQASAQPSNKVAAASNAAGSLAAVLAGVMTGYAGPALTELAGEWGKTHPSTLQLGIALVAALAAYIATRAGARAAAYNVLDKPNVPLAPVANPAP